MKKKGYAAAAFLAGLCTGGILVRSRMEKPLCEKDITTEKFRMLYHMLERWLEMKQMGRSLEDYFVSNSYRKIAVYGMGEAGMLLAHELDGSAVKIEYGIDKNVKVESPVPMFHPNEQLPEIDAVVVTAIAYFGEIEEMLKKKLACPVLALDEIIYEVSY